jgi:sugar O-acyltransferase (sialic acid O-acetyltransferase NeuD family)
MELKLNVRPRLLVIGASGHASVLIDAIELAGVYDVAGYLDDTVGRGTDRRGYPVLGGLDDAVRVCMEQLIESVVIAIGDNWRRREIYSDLLGKCPKLKFPVVKHPSAEIARTSEIGRGTAILAGCHVGPGSRVGEFCIINTGSSLDHDCEMHDFASIAPGVFTGGLVQIGKCSAVGVGASISDRISIGSHAVVGTGSVVVRNIPALVVAYGNPARVRRPRRESEAYMSTNDTVTSLRRPE